MNSPEAEVRRQQLIEAAKHLVEPQRAAFLAAACASEPELLADLEAYFHAQAVADLSGTRTQSQPHSPSLPSIGHYNIKQLLGRGGMGEVYQAVDTKLGRPVAIKTLAPKLIDDPAARQRFLREARAASLLSHPSICTVYEVGQHEQTIFIAMQFIQGQTIQQLLARAPIPLERALAYALDVADALHEAHTASIVHRDIKPSNVIVNERDVAVVLDFGLAKQIQPDASDKKNVGELPGLDDVTTHLGLTGTIPYMSPEQVRTERLDGRSDIFSFGVLLYEMLTRKRPFKGASDIDTLHQILHDEPPLVHELNPALPAELAQLVKKAMAKDRAARYQTLTDLKEDLVALIHANDYVVRGISTARSGSQRVAPASLQEAETKELQQFVTAPNVASTSVKTAAVDTNASASSLFTKRNVGLALLAGVLLGGISWLVFERNRAATVPLPTALKMTEVVNWSSTPGEVYSAGTFSPDGKRIAYTSTASGIKSIWVKQVAAGNPVQITTDDFKNENPIWSPDGEELAYFSLRGNHYGIWRVPYLGGNATELVQLDAGDVVLCAWAKSNTLYYRVKNNLFALDVKTRTASQLTQFEASKTNISYLQIAPDETRIAYRTVDEKQVNSLWVMPKQGGNAVQVASHPDEIRNIVWHPDGKRLLYSAAVAGSYQIYSASVDGAAPVPLTAGDNEAFMLDLSADGTKILVGSSKEESDVWGVKLGKAEEFTVATEINAELWPAVSNGNGGTGQLLAFQSIRNLSQGDKLTAGAILAKPLTGTGGTTELTANGYLPQWSPDGQQLAFLQLDANANNLMRVGASGGKATRLATGVSRVINSILPYNRQQASEFQWSPDSQTIAYGSKKGGQSNLWLVKMNDQVESQLTTNSDDNLRLFSPFWSVDGKQVAYLAKTDKPGADGKVSYAVWVIEVASKQARMIYQAKSFLRLLGWSPDGMGLLLATLNDQPSTSAPTTVSLLQVGLATGAARSLATLSATYLYNLHLSPERKRIAYVARPDGKDNLWSLPIDGGPAQKLTTNNDARLYFSSLAWAPDGKALYFGKQSRYSLLSMLADFH